MIQLHKRVPLNECYTEPTDSMTTLPSVALSAFLPTQAIQGVITPAPLSICHRSRYAMEMTSK